MEVVQEEMPQSISATKKEEVTGNHIQLHRMELHDSYPLQNIIRLIKLQVVTGGARGPLGRKDIGTLGLVGKPDSKRPLGRQPDIESKKILKWI
jgi:hypothetical protein